MDTLFHLIMCGAVVVSIGSGAWGQDEKVEPGKLPRRVIETLKRKFRGAKITTATIENGNPKHRRSCTITKM